ncbi:unnamed protein product [Allacma fusca]|uniref:Gustatory receptor n=1 Tax=Allacma fusca TaxID=39272 RepID=A0A8J2PR08_9HEXA|nr:unnamed protein product [Allacma fusca]
MIIIYAGDKIGLSRDLPRQESEHKFPEICFLVVSSQTMDLYLALRHSFIHRDRVRLLCNEDEHRWERRSGSICILFVPDELTKTLAKSGVQTALRDPSQCTSSEIIYILAALQLLVYSIFRAYYFDLSGGETNSLLFQLFPSSKVTWLRISVQIIFVIFDLLHSCCIHFAFSFLFLAGIELAQNFEKIVNLTLKFSREYSYQIDAIDDLRTEFIALKNCFNIYGEVSGIFFLALFFEVFPDSFRAIIFMIFDSDSSKTSPSHQLTFTVHCIGAFTGMLLLILVINVGHDLMVALGEGKDRVLMMVYDGTNGMFGQEEVNLGKMILHWNWSFSAAGFFPIDRSLFPGIFALLTTYTLIVFQMKLSDQCQVVF